ncbi:hypothetical protein J8L98_00435 [Pseudoalteromonas sp. MMG013]|uniref:di-heme oxidoreductase family protein n=1 Tax=Pseudoalteromonas sp. MMG013 TaxID=2822687 RepID=UPI001B365080|nr:di-heme oxidoredictase family protein [Pseudoalteromonas sp. MMG013]MBQ4860155.1 hypothetical protein [Pseudoalteromonas sp. MMG013]
MIIRRNYRLNMRIIIGVILFVGAALYKVAESFGDTPQFSASELKPGGETTRKSVSHRTFVYPAENVPIMTQLDFWDGFSFFRDPWVASPAITKDRDGLGPLFNARSCKTCHVDGGRGKPPKHGELAPPALLFRFLNIKSYMADSRYGGQLQPLNVRLSHANLDGPVKGEGQVRVFYDQIVGTYTDGTEYTLRKPRYQFENYHYGQMDSDSRLSARYAPAVYGMGLLDAIKAEDLLVQEDIDDLDGDGVSGKYNFVVDAIDQTRQIGRFGFKGLHSTLEQQIAGAFVNDIGITNPIFEQEQCLPHQVRCQQAADVDPNGTLDIPKKLHDLTVFMGQTIAVPPARDLTSDQAIQGRKLFYQIGCNTCHTPSYITDPDYAIAAIAGQKIWPYTDLALHDMGEGLADEGIENSATGIEWRTPPLWGIGLQKRVQGFAAYLHDGRARTIEEAVLWHGGEAKSHQQKFIDLKITEREALLHFINQI